MRRFVLIGFILLIISIIITLNIFFQQNYQREMAEQLNSQQVLIAKAVSATIGSHLEHIEEEMVAFARMLGRRGLHPEGFVAFVQDGFAEGRTEEGVELKILTREGRLIYPEGRQTSDEDRRMFDLALDLKRSQVHIFDHSSEHQMVELTTPVVGEDGRVLGLILVTIHIDAINNKFLHPIKSGERGYAWMMDDKGTLIYHPTQRSMLGKNIYNADESCFVSCHTSFRTEKMILSTPADSGVSSYVSPLGEDKLVAFSRLTKGSFTWIVCVTIPYSEVTAKIQDSMRLHSVLVLFTFAMTVMGAVIIVMNNQGRIKAEEKARHLEKERDLEHQVLQAKNYLENILENTQALIMVIQTDFTIRTVNTACQGFCGRSPQEMIGASFLEMFPFAKHEDRAVFIRHIQDCLAGEVKQILEYPLECGGRRVVINIIMSPLRMHGEVLGVILSGSEITEEVLLKDKIREYATELEEIVKERTLQLMSEKEKLNALVQAIEAGIGIFDDQGNPVWVNRVLEEWLPPETSGLIRLPDLFAGPNVTDSMHVALKQKGLWQEVLYRDFGRKSGYFQITATPLISSVSRHETLVLIQDVTDVRKAEERMIQSEKLSALARLSAGVAHEIGNPLTSISSYVQILEEGDYNDFTREALKTISRQISRIAVIVRQMSTFTKIRETDVRAQSVQEIVDRTLQLVRYDKRMKKIEIKADLPESVPPVLVNGDQLEQVFINIILNSGDAMPEGGHLDVSLHQSGKFVDVVFRDTGPGIPPERIERIFEPFFTTKEHGTGLGLSVSYSLVRGFGGNILVESRPGEGSTFTVRLPAYEG